MQRWMMLFIHLVFTILIPLSNAQLSTTPQECQQIIPTYSLDNGITFHTPTLFDFVSFLPPFAAGEGHDAEIRALIVQAKERCNLQSSSTAQFSADVDSTTRSFRAACFSLKRSFSISRGVELDVEMNNAKTVEEAAVLAAISLAYHSLKGHSQCGEVCPCIFEDAQPVCTVPTDTGLCAAATAPPSPSPSPASAVLPVVPAEAAESESAVEESIAPSAPPMPSEDDMTVITISATTFPSPSSTPDEQITIVNADADKAELTPEPLIGMDIGRVPAPSDSTTASAKSPQPLSLGALIGIGIAGFVCIAIIGLFAAQQIAFRRRHADEIEQWRNAFRVVEN